MMDLHCHVDLYPDHQEVLSDIKSSNYYVLSVTTVPSAFEGTVQLTSGIKHCKTALGLHPQLAHLRKNELALFDKLVDRTRYIGEIGLDGSKGYAEHIEDQLFIFKHILNKCQSRKGKVLTIHSLNAIEETLDCLTQYPDAGKPILHWFLGSKKQLARALELGCFFSVGPAMIHSSRAKKIISWIPNDKILLETDGPFAKVAGRIQFPSDVMSVVEYLSQQWGVAQESVVSQLEYNLKNVVSS